MKFIASILSIYILVLVAIPCIDHPEDHGLQNTENTQSTADNHQHEGDQCSPFCTCDCCVSPIIYSEITVRSESFPVLLGCLSPEYSSVFISRYSGSIWQPPQLA